jgi:hypothetical protein
LSIHNASIATQSEGLTFKLMRFMEQDDYPSSEYGTEIAEELYSRIKAFPGLAPVITKNIMLLYAERINRLCDHYEFSHVHAHAHSERECI